MNENVYKLRDNYISLRRELDERFAQQKLLLKDVIIILDNESNYNKRKKIIDIIFDNNVEELFEHMLRKEYLK